MVRVPEIDLQDQRSSGRRNPVTRRGGRASGAPHRLCCLALCMSVMGASLLSAAGVAVGQNATPSSPDARLQAPIGHRQPRPSDLPPSVQRDEQLDPQSAQAQPQKQTPNRRASGPAARAGSVPTIDVRKSCEVAEKDVGSIFGPNNGVSLGSCLKQEQEARQEIIDSWTKYPQIDKQSCINTTGYLPSYVEWLTCLEMSRDVRSLDSATKSVGAGTR
jgi:hypothetical protein